MGGANARIEDVTIVKELLLPMAEFSKYTLSRAPRSSARRDAAPRGRCARQWPRAYGRTSHGGRVSSLHEVVRARSISRFRRARRGPVDPRFAHSRAGLRALGI